MLARIIEEIINEAKDGKITIESDEGNWSFFAKFYVNEYKDDMYPSITIANYDIFVNKMKEYLDVAKDFYCKDQDFYGLKNDAYIKKLVFDLLVNISLFEANDIYNYIDMKKNMLRDKTIKEGEFFLNDYMGVKTVLTIRRNSSNLEAPYQFIVSFKDNEGNVFELPQITFGIENNVGHLMCIQNKNKNDNKLIKKMDRFFRKVNKDVDMESDLGLVSPRALVSLTIFNSYLKNIGVHDVVVSSYMPIRYNSKIIKKQYKGVSEKEIEDEIELADKIQFNITNKMMYLIKRYVYHFNDCEYEYDDIKESMYLKIKDTRGNSNNIIVGIDNVFSKNDRVDR